MAVLDLLDGPAQCLKVCGHVESIPMSKLAYIRMLI
jgi:hypothetical protein